MRKRLLQNGTGILLAGISWCLAGCVDPQASLVPQPTQDPVAIRHLHLPRPVPFVRQSSDGACWLACAAMVYDYYGQPFSEHEMDVVVKRLTLDPRGGQKSGNLRNCLVALAQMGGVAEAIRAKNGGSGTYVPDPLSGFWMRLESNGAIKDPLSIIHCLNDADPPVIICKVDDPRSSEEHAMLVVGAEVEISPGSRQNLLIRSVDTVDPSSQDGQIKPRSAAYLSTHLRSVLSRNMAQQILTEEIQNHNTYQ